jgi:hypothetical protein
LQLAKIEPTDAHRNRSQEKADCRSDIACHLRGFNAVRVAANGLQMRTILDNKKRKVKPDENCSREMCWIKDRNFAPRRRRQARRMAETSGKSLRRRKRENATASVGIPAMLRRIACGKYFSST